MLSINYLSPILIVEDNPEDVELIKWAINKLSIPMRVAWCQDGEEALDYLYRREEYENPDKSPRPALVLLDLTLITLHGHDILQRIKQDDDLKHIPVIIWTSSEKEQDVEVSFSYGANSYILKPMGVQSLLHAVEMLNTYWFGVTILPDPDSDM